MRELCGVRSFLIDLDGTLVDSSPLHDQAYRRVIESEAPHLLSGYDYRQLMGIATGAAFARLGVEEAAEVERLTTLKQRLYRNALKRGELAEKAGARNLVQAMNQAGNVVSIVTSASRQSALAALEMTGLASFVDNVVAAEDAPGTKPRPDAYLEALRQSGVPLAASIAVEDALSGVIAARAAGLRVIGVHDESLTSVCEFYFPDLTLFREAVDAARLES
ncbi:MAG: HAD family hydrolase [Caulobacteraceae bacterium]